MPSNAIWSQVILEIVSLDSVESSMRSPRYFMKVDAAYGRRITEILEHSVMDYDSSSPTKGRGDDW